MANIRPANDLKLPFPHVIISANDMFLPSMTDYVQSMQLTVLALLYVVRCDGLLQLDHACIDIKNSLQY